MTNNTPLAGFEFSPGQTIGIIAVLSLIALFAILYVSFFTVYLVTSVQELHRRGVLGHPSIVVFASLGALAAAFEYRATMWGPILGGGGIVLGYVAMLWAGTTWFRWTAVPSTCIVLMLAGAR